MIRIERDEFGDITASSDEPMTVNDLIKALVAMPRTAIVRRYCDWDVTAVEYESPGSEVYLR